MFEYKSCINNFLGKSFYGKSIFAKIDVDKELVIDMPDQVEQFSDDKQDFLPNLINSIQEAISAKNNATIEYLITKLNAFINTQQLTSLLIIHCSNIIPILVNQLNREFYLDKIKLASIQCLHKLMFQYIEFVDIAIKNLITTPLYIILKQPVTPTTEHALCIIINIFSDHSEFIPELINYFNPKIFTNLFIEREFEKGFARLLVLKSRQRIKILVCKLFLLYSTIKLNEEYIQIILNFFDSIIYHKNEDQDDFYSLILQAIRGICILFSSNNDKLNYLKMKSINLYDLILNSLNFYQNLNDFEMMSEIVELFTNLIYIGANYNDNLINSIIQMIFHSLSSIENSSQNEYKSFKIISFNLFNLLIEKKYFFKGGKIFFENTVLNFLCNSIENDSFDVACAAFNVLSNITKNITSDQIKLVLIDDIFQSFFKIMQSYNHDSLVEAISSLLILHMKSQNYGLKNKFVELFLKNDFNMNEVIEFESESIPSEILNQFFQLLNSLGN